MGVVLSVTRANDDWTAATAAYMIIFIHAVKVKTIKNNTFKMPTDQNSRDFHQNRPAPKR